MTGGIHSREPWRRDRVSESAGMSAHIDEGAVFSSLLLFATERFELRLEVGGPRLTGKHKLGGETRWLAAAEM